MNARLESNAHTKDGQPTLVVPIDFSHLLRLHMDSWNFYSISPISGDTGTVRYILPISWVDYYCRLWSIIGEKSLSLQHASTLLVLFKWNLLVCCHLWECNCRLKSMEPMNQNNHPSNGR